MASFNRTNRQASELEKFIVAALIKNGFINARIDHNNTYFPDWDIYVNDKHTIECKDDDYAHHKSKNICIEYGQYRYSDGVRFDSGILNTKSTIWLQSNGIEYDDTTLYLAKTNLVRKMFDFTKNFINEFNKINSDDELNNLISEVEKEKDMEILFREGIYPIRKVAFLTKCPVPQGKNEPDKDMDLFLIPQDIYKKYCLEVAHKNEITFKDLK